MGTVRSFCRYERGKFPLMRNMNHFNCAMASFIRRMASVIFPSEVA
ncbi:hypothetical protein EZS27_010968 [termite gut metagenome]|uniref:Uncharacterized protein n=1 Tax=termite gut metagenome TaxID=433724 RepID=A0A5J4S783_9ZZZZ